MGMQSWQKCALCGADGAGLYAKLRDRLFGADGTWGFLRCPAPRCGLIWLDPRPLNEDLSKAYEGYYTHAAETGSARAGLLKRIYSRIKEDYICNRYGYSISSPQGRGGFAGTILYLF